MKAIIELIRTFGPARIAAMAAVVAILIGVFTAIIYRVSEPQMIPVYTDLTFDDSAQIIRQLESSATPYELRNDGATILVPRDQVFRLRMRLAESGLPTGGSVGYEIFDRTDTLGATSFVQNINHLRALEGELARTIRSISQISAARVHLVIPERKLFQRDNKPPSASIVLKIRGSLDGGQVRAIQHLVATAVEGLAPQFISVVDETGRLLASGIGDDGTVSAPTLLHERTADGEARLRRELITIVDSVVGAGRSRVNVALELDYNRITETAENFDPESQVVRSTQSREENSNSKMREDGVTAANQLPDAGDQASGPGEEEQSSSVEETVNYEISRTTTTKILEVGGIKRISVAVLVDGVYVPDEAGVLTYEPRSEDELERIQTLVRSAIGFDDARGDQVEVVNLRFAAGPETLLAEEEAGGFEFTNADLMHLAELGILAIIVLLLLFLVIRPLMKRMLQGETAETQLELLDTDGQPLETPALTDESAPQQEDADDLKIGWLEAAKAAGTLRGATIQQIGQMVDDNPREAANIIRSWLKEAA